MTGKPGAPGQAPGSESAPPDEPGATFVRPVSEDQTKDLLRSPSLSSGEGDPDLPRLQPDELLAGRVRARVVPTAFVSARPVRRRILPEVTQARRPADRPAAPSPGPSSSSGRSAPTSSVARVAEAPAGSWPSSSAPPPPRPSSSTSASPPDRSPSLRPPPRPSSTSGEPRPSPETPPWPRAAAALYPPVFTRFHPAPPPLPFQPLSGTRGAASYPDSLTRMRVECGLFFLGSSAPGLHPETVPGPRQRCSQPPFR